MTLSDFKLLLRATGKIYLKALGGAFTGAVRNWKLLFAQAVVLVVVWGVSKLAVLFGALLGGFIMGLALAFVLALYLSSLSLAVQGERAEIKEVWHGGIALFGATISSLFFLYLLQLICELVLRGTERRWMIMVVNLLLSVFFNPLPEIIYSKPRGISDMLRESVEFVQENFIEWFIPFAVLLLPVAVFVPQALTMVMLNILLTNPFEVIQGFFLTFGSPALLLGNAGLMVLIIYLFYFVFIFRGLLFQHLSSSSRRKRIYQQKFA